MHLTFHQAQFLPSTTLFTTENNLFLISPNNSNQQQPTTTKTSMTIGSTIQNRGTLSSKNLHIQEHKRNWKPRKHQRSDKLNWMKQNNQSRSVGWKYGDKRAMEMMKE